MLACAYKLDGLSKKYLKTINYYSNFSQKMLGSILAWFFEEYVSLSMLSSFSSLYPFASTTSSGYSGW